MFLFLYRAIVCARVCGVCVWVRATSNLAHAVVRADDEGDLPIARGAGAQARARSRDRRHEKEKGREKAGSRSFVRSKY